MFAFEKLEVYTRAYRANEPVYRFLKTNSKLVPYIKNQFGRASLSVMLNIAEGTAKFGRRDRRNFYITARGSLFECAALIAFLCNEGDLEPSLKDELSRLYEEISKMLYMMIKKLERES